MIAQKAYYLAYSASLKLSAVLIGSISRMGLVLQHPPKLGLSGYIKWNAEQSSSKCFSLQFYHGVTLSPTKFD